jgi:hypothetical protein
MQETANKKPNDEEKTFINASDIKYTPFYRKEHVDHAARETSSNAFVVAAIALIIAALTALFK